MSASEPPLPNLGRKSRALLAAVGIMSLAQLRGLGAHQCNPPFFLNSQNS
jgi:hypothetical protein